MTFAFDGDREIVSMENIISVYTQQSQILVVVLTSSQVETLTKFLWIFFDTLMNFVTLRDIIRFHRQGTSAANEARDQSLKILALKEFLELLIPLVFVLSFVGSYFGPNYEIIGGMGSDVWHHEKTTSLIDKLQKMIIFMTMEILRGIGFASALWYFYGLSLYRGYCYVIRKLGWLLFFLLAYNYQLVNGHYLMIEFKEI